MNLKSMMVSERSQKQKATYYMIPLTWRSGNGSPVGREIRSVVAWSWELGEGIEYREGPGNFWGWWEYLHLDGRGFIWLQMFVKTHKKCIYVKMNPIECKFYWNRSCLKRKEKLIKAQRDSWACSKSPRKFLNADSTSTQHLVLSKRIVCGEK